MCISTKGERGVFSAMFCKIVMEILIQQIPFLIMKYYYYLLQHVFFEIMSLFQDYFCIVTVEMQLTVKSKKKSSSVLPFIGRYNFFCLFLFQGFVTSKKSANKGWQCESSCILSRTSQSSCLLWCCGVAVVMLLMSKARGAYYHLLNHTRQELFFQ